MPTIEIKDGLIEHLLSDKLESISMALGLLLERIASEAMLPRADQEMIRALLEHVQTQSEERYFATRRIIALLLLVGGSDVANHIAWGLYHYYNQPGHQEQLTQTFLLLGKEAEEVLLEMMHYHATPPELLAEVVGILGMMVPHQDVYEYAKAIGYPGLPMFQTSMTYPERLAVALRALGGLLAGGHLNSSTLQDRQASSLYGSPEHELYSILLGKPYGPLITKLENDLRSAEYEYEKARRQLAIQLTLMQREKEEWKRNPPVRSKEPTIRNDNSAVARYVTPGTPGLKNTFSQAYGIGLFSDSLLSFWLASLEDSSTYWLFLPCEDLATMSFSKFFEGG